MKAAVVVANEDVQYLEIPEPEVKPVSYTHLTRIWKLRS